MSKSDYLRFQDVRDCYRLIGECRDLGHEPALWHPHVFQGMCRLLGVPQAAGGEGSWTRPGGSMEVISAHGVSADATAYERFLAYNRANGMASDPLWHALRKVPGQLITRTRRQLVSDAVWYRSGCFNEFRRPARIDHDMVSVLWMPNGGAISVIALIRLIGERDFSPREQRMLDFFHAEIGRLIGGPLISALEPGPDRLAPRLRQTLACLLEGDNEKQVAARLGLSHPTVHQYVTALYRHFGVRSRAQLLAHAMRRMQQERWRRLLPCAT